MVSVNPFREDRKGQHMKPIATALTSTILAAGLVAASLALPAVAEEKKDFKVAWSIYVGWMPWGYAADHGIAQKWPKNTA